MKLKKDEFSRLGRMSNDMDYLYLVSEKKKIYLTVGRTMIWIDWGQRVVDLGCRLREGVCRSHGVGGEVGNDEVEEQVAKTQLLVTEAECWTLGVGYAWAGEAVFAIKILVRKYILNGIKIRWSKNPMQQSRLTFLIHNLFYECWSWKYPPPPEPLDLQTLAGSQSQVGYPRSEISPLKRLGLRYW